MRAISPPSVHCMVWLKFLNYAHTIKADTYLTLCRIVAPSKSPSQSTGPETHSETRVAARSQPRLHQRPSLSLPLRCPAAQCWGQRPTQLLVLLAVVEGRRLHVGWIWLSDLGRARP